MDRTEQLKNLVENCRDLILKTERDIWASPETGYHEWKTNAYMEKLFEDLGYTLTKAGDIPGFYTDVETGKPGPKVAILDVYKRQFFTSAGPLHLATLISVLSPCSFKHWITALVTPPPFPNRLPNTLAS